MYDNEEKSERTESQKYGDMWAEVYQDYISGEYDDFLRRDSADIIDDVLDFEDIMPF